MRLSFKSARAENTQTLFRRLGYSPDRLQNPGEPSYHRRLRTLAYPRFHVYIQVDMARELTFTIHLDMKQPSYQGSAAHSGEYGGPVVENEAERIKNLIDSLLIR